MSSSTNGDASNWASEPISKLVEKVDKWNPKSSTASSTFTYIDLSSVDRHEKRIVDPQQVECSEAPSRARQIVRSNDVLVATVRPNLNGVATVPEDLNEATASTGFCVLRPKSSILDSGFLFHWVKTPRFVRDMVRKATGANYPAVSDRIIGRSKIPLPSLDEQKRIAEVLDRAEALRARRRAALALLDELTQSIFLDMFGDPVTNPKNWPVGKIGDLDLKIADGNYSAKYPKSSEFVESGVPFIRANNMVNMTIDADDMRFISTEKHAELRKGHLETGDVLLTTHCSM